MCKVRTCCSSFSAVATMPVCESRIRMSNLQQYSGLTLFDCSAISDVEKSVGNYIHDVQAKKRSLFITFQCALINVATLNRQIFSEFAALAHRIQSSARGIEYGLVFLKEPFAV